MRSSHFKIFPLAMDLLVILWLMSLAGCAHKPAPVEKLTGLLLNYDSTDLFYYTPPDKISGQAVDDQMDQFARAGVTVLMCNVNAQRTNYNSAVFDPFWRGYDPQAGEDQPFLQDMAYQSRTGYRKMIESMWALHKQGVDYPARVIARCRHNGLSPWISLRMNDIHNNDELNHPIHSTFWKNHHECWRVSDRRIDYYDRALDYSHESVRHRFWELIQEVLDRYDMDGLELDFMREPFLFRPGHEGEGAVILNEWLQQVRQLVDQTAAKRGHPIKMGVRVPANPITAQNLGLDVVHWAQQGWVDLVVVTPRWATLDTQMPLALWKKLLAPYRVTLAGGLEIREQAYPDGPARLALPETAIGAATTVLSSGADVVYLFNYFSTLSNTLDYWSPAKYQETLQAMSSLKNLDLLPRRHMVTFHDVFAPGEATDHALPAKGNRVSFRLLTGPQPIGREVTASVGLAPVDEEILPPPELRVNSIPCALQKRENNVFIFRVAEPTLVDGIQVLEIAGAAKQVIQVVQVELNIAGANQ